MSQLIESSGLITSWILRCEGLAAGEVGSGDDDGTTGIVDWVVIGALEAPPPAQAHNGNPELRAGSLDDVGPWGCSLESVGADLGTSSDAEYVLAHDTPQHDLDQGGGVGAESPCV